jgi:hypothetical protein
MGAGEVSRMKEAVVRKALDKLSWSELAAHLETDVFDNSSLEELLSQLRRCGALICKLPDAKRELSETNYFIHLSSS